MVSTKDEKVLWILDLVGEQKADSLQRLFSAIYIVTQKNVVGFRREAAVFKEAQKIIVLTVNISTNLDGCFELEKHGLSNEKITRTEAQHFDFSLGQIHLLAWSSSSHTVNKNRSVLE
jgi:hypothetical protein